jgi:hypothetical protein
LNNKKLEIYRSFDGVNFDNIGAIAGKGTTSQVSRYDFMDVSIPVDAKDVYYRIKQVDFDGKFEFSPIRKVTFVQDLLTIWPNPASHQLHINTNADVFEVVVYDLMGSRVLTTRNESSVVIESLPKGLYFAEIRTSEKKSVHKFVKL